MAAWRGALAGAALLGGGALAYSFWEARRYRVRELTVPAPRAEARGLRLLHVTDVHLLPGDRRRVEFVRSLAGLAPDLVVSTGDNLSSPAALPALLEAYEPLLGLPGLFVFGSNDYYAPVPKSPWQYVRKALGWQELEGQIEADRPLLPTQALREAFVRAGWFDANNGRGAVRAGGLEVSVVGLDDPHIGLDCLPPAPTGTFVDDAAALRLGVVHAPYSRALEALVDAGAELVLSGHTHGGQLCVPGYGALVTNCDLPRAAASGLSWWQAPAAPSDGAMGADEGGTGTGTGTGTGDRSTRRPGAWLHVDAGIGTAPHTPVRFACAPGATLLTLT
ncbi:metallophosphoesterase [Buchananella felis]|uniref:metallophosphoesterase n=1 Tax=Buchananella felis TaxID=3231492 RepID=UPI0035298E11